MSRADIQYLGIIKNILDAGSLGDNRTGMPAYKLPHQIMQFDLEKEFPILTTKFVAFKTSVKEILWIWQKQSNDVRLLQQWNCHVWDEWMREDGTIGKAYGYQLGKYHQVDTLLETLKKDPQSRRMVVDLWNVKDLPDMAQYAALVHMIAQVSGLRVGLFTHVINNAHVYKNHVDAMKTQLARLPKAYDAPVLKLNPDVHNFYDFKPEDIVLENYKHHEKIAMEVSV